MKGLLVLLALVMVCCSASALVFPNGAERIDIEDAEVLFEQHILTFNKVYDASELKEKFSNFKASIERINDKNSRSEGAIFGLNKFSDMSTGEFKANVLGHSIQINSHPAIEEPVADAPPSFDWREKKAVTAVKNQKYHICNDGWAMAPVEAVESASILAGNIPNEWLSTQQILDCDPYANACSGGEPNATYAYMQEAGGLMTNAAYPYLGEESGNCSFNASLIVAPVKSYQINISLVHPNEKGVQYSVLNQGPVAVAVDATAWQDYKSGVMKSVDCSIIINFLTHVVQVVGYNATSTARDSSYWIVRNSWGVEWGIDGYIYLEMWKDTCGLAHVVSWPIV